MTEENSIKDSLIEFRRTHNSKNGKKGTLTQIKLAKDIGVKRATYSSWERGLANPPLGTLKALARYFGVLIDDLVGNDSWISVRDDLPKELGGECRLRIWLYAEYKGGEIMDEGTFKDGKFYLNGRDITKDVKSWRPIPQKPKK